MIGYTTVGTNDLEKAATFYDQLLLADDVQQVRPNDRIVFWMRKGAPMFGVSVPFDGEPATAGNGTMIALNVDTTEQVHAIYEKALGLGATDEGEPGPRGTRGFYGGYFRDLDGNKLTVFTRVKV